MATPPTFSAGAVLTAAQMNAVGLWLVKSQTIGTTVSSVQVTAAFSSDYDNYRIIISGGASSTAAFLTLVFGATTTGYYAAYSGVAYSTAAASLAADNNAASFTQPGVAWGATGGLQMALDVQGPNLATYTSIQGGYPSGSSARMITGYLANTTQYTAFTIAPSSGTLTGGEIRVYGYRN